MDIIWNPQEIEKKSMEIIEAFLAGYSWSPLQKAIVKRIIHTTGDPDLVSALRFHPHAAQSGYQALRAGCNIYTDVNMLKSGVNQVQLEKQGGQVFCSISDPRVIEESKNTGITRAAAAMRLYGRELDGSVVAIGNAPTALFEVLNIVDQGIARPALIVGTPVGFVGAAESKAMLVQNSPVPYISLLGTRGGSPIAVSIVNALLYYEGD